MARGKRAIIKREDFFAKEEKENENNKIEEIENKKEMNKEIKEENENNEVEEIKEENENNEVEEKNKKVLSLKEEIEEKRKDVPQQFDLEGGIVPRKYLDLEEFLNIQLIQSKIEKINLNIENSKLKNQIEQQNFTNKMKSLNEQRKNLNEERKKLNEEIEKRLGISLKNKSINAETLEIEGV